MHNPTMQKNIINIKSQDEADTEDLKSMYLDELAERLDKLLRAIKYSDRDSARRICEDALGFFSNWNDPVAPWQASDACDRFLDYLDDIKYHWRDNRERLMRHVSEEIVDNSERLPEFLKAYDKILEARGVR